ncbi:cartilage acidic protein 1-like [Ylistrum balloti]|uniref:cartilage acidic protein 1-like n=1 Tax=Ylistrum balloti TaxID=509963 RepID=UPI002905F204|nr:cartilage acidic protein 1-like [Ylistrum balloti]
MTYGAAVSDVSGDGHLDIIVASFSSSNIVLSYDNKSRALKNIAVTGTPFEALMDSEGRAVGVAACDIDGDGREEIYILNSNADINWREKHSDKVFKYVENRYVDLLSDSVNAWIQEVTYMGHSVTCIDRQGKGRYAFAVMTSSQSGDERFLLLEMDTSHPANNITSGPIVLKDVAKEAGLDIVTGGRGFAIGPILGTDGRSDIFVNINGERNEIGENKLFMNIGGGKFRNVARQLGLTDRHQKGRDVALGDINQDGLVDIIAGNWLGPQRLFIQQISSYSKNVKFIDMAHLNMRQGSALCSIALADFNNDGYTEIMFNNVMHHGAQPNRLFTVNTTKLSTGHDFEITEVSIGDALEPRAYSTGSLVTDIDMDGVLDLLITHGESSGQTITLYSTASAIETMTNFTFQRSHIARNKTFVTNLTRNILRNKSLSISRFENYWVRIIPKTRYAAPARGSKVTLVLAGGEMMTQIIDGGSGYRGRIEPVAHFGIGRNPNVLLLEVQWPDGKIYQREMGVGDLNSVLEIRWSHLYKYKSIFENKHVDKQLRRRSRSACVYPSNVFVILLCCLCIVLWCSQFV